MTSPLYTYVAFFSQTKYHNGVRNIRRDHSPSLASIPVKANRLLNVVLFLLLLIALRLWHLAIIQHDKKSEEAFLARTKVVVQAAERGTIRDRFNIVLATNTTDFRLGIIYASLREIPQVIFDKTSTGERRKVYLRKMYIRALAELIEREVGLDQERVVDLIYSYAAQNNNIPYILKNHLTEQEYYRLKMLEKDWPGLHVERIPKRSYPHGKALCHILGYLAPIQKEQYEKVLSDIHTTASAITVAELGLGLPAPFTTIEEAKKSLTELQERAYTINDHIGTLGVEASFENYLRGFYGKEEYFSDAKGNFVRSLQSQPPLSGKRLVLSISLQLQEYAEKLLAESEKVRKSAAKQEQEKTHERYKEPWIRGGSIVAIDPKNGQVVALASFPRFDPNDFIQANENVKRWIENEEYEAATWNQKIGLVQEEVGPDGSMQEKEELLEWDRFLEWILPPHCPIKTLLSENTSLEHIIALQSAFNEILKRAPTLSPEEVMSLLYEQGDEPYVGQFLQDVATYKAVLDRALQPLQNTKERLLLLDLSRLIIQAEEINTRGAAATELSRYSIREFRALSSTAVFISELLKKEAKKIFRLHTMKAWRSTHEKAFLQAKRVEEKRAGKYPRPYLEYIDKHEKEAFDAFWKKWKEALLTFACTKNSAAFGTEFVELEPYIERFAELHDKIKPLFPYAPELLHICKGYMDITHPLYGRYRGLGTDAKSLASSFMKSVSGHYLRSYAFRESSIQGSIFKLITGYTALKQLYLEKQGSVSPKDMQLFEISDHYYKMHGKTFVGNFSNGQPIPQLYKGGRIPKSLNLHLGTMNLLRAIETSSNPYFSLLAGDFLHDPTTLIQCAQDFGYGEKSGIQLPYEIKGNLPQDIATNKTGLYATAIGQHTLVNTPLQSSCMIAALANGGDLLRPQIALLAAGRTISEQPSSVNEVEEFSRHVRRSVFLPVEIQNTLFEGMRRCTSHAQEEYKRKRFIGAGCHFLPRVYKEFTAMQGLIGKTSTSEVVERIGLDVGDTPHMYRHIWYGGIAFPQNNGVFTFQDPELVVVVYLRYGGYGKDAAPIAAAIVNKWREIMSSHSRART